MIKVIVNGCYGGLGFSRLVYEKLGIKWDNYGYLDNEKLDIESKNYQEFRTSLKLIKVIEEIGLKEASGSHAELRIAEIPDDVEWEIDEYDGIESVHEVHRSW
jgi:hypothetical protein